MCGGGKKIKRKQETTTKLRNQPIRKRHVMSRFVARTSPSVRYVLWANE